MKSNISPVRQPIYLFLLKTIILSRSQITASLGQKLGKGTAGWLVSVCVISRVSPRRIQSMGKNPLEASSFTERQRLTFIVYLDPFWGRQTEAAPGLPVWPGLHLNMAALNFLNGDQGSRGECLKRQEVLDASSKGWTQR